LQREENCLISKPVERRFETSGVELLSILCTCNQVLPVSVLFCSEKAGIFFVFIYFFVFICKCEKHLLETRRVGEFGSLLSPLHPRYRGKLETAGRAKQMLACPELFQQS
jgi:hypothetical protein